MSNSLWDETRAENYLSKYFSPTEKRGTQSLLCKDISKYVPVGSVMDFGCGMGHLIPYLTSHEYIGFDYSPTMLKYLEDFFPGITTVQGDATLPYDEFKTYLEECGVPTQSETSVSVSLFIHLPTVDDVRNLLKNMWETCIKNMVFGVETAGNKKIVTTDGLTLRNISIQNVLGMLEELDIPLKNVNTAHQKISYRQYFSIFPTSPQPLQMDSPKLHTRTTIFKVRKD